jgi:hypothetical protein
MTQDNPPLSYAALTVWEDEGIYIDVIGPSFRTQDEAATFARDTPLALLLHEDEGEIALTLMSTNSMGFSMNPEPSQVRMSHVPYRENAPPLDPRDPAQLKIIMDALGDMDSPYCITEDDMLPLDWTLKKLAEAISPLPRRFSSMAYGVEEISQ